MRTFGARKFSLLKLASEMHSWRKVVIFNQRRNFVFTGFFFVTNTVPPLSPSNLFKFKWLCCCCATTFAGVCRVWQMLKESFLWSTGRENFPLYALFLVDITDVINIGTWGSYSISCRVLIEGCCCQVSHLINCFLVYFGVLRGSVDLLS